MWPIFLLFYKLPTLSQKYFLGLMSQVDFFIKERINIDWQNLSKSIYWWEVDSWIIMCVDLNLAWKKISLYTCNNWLLYKIYQCNNNKSTKKNDKWSSFSKGLMKTCVWLAPHKLNFCHTPPLAKFRLPLGSLVEILTKPVVHFVQITNRVK